MKTRTRNVTSEREDPFFYEEEKNLDLESLSDEEVESLLFNEEEKPNKGFWNLPTMAGLSLILVGVAYLFQELGMWNGFDISVLVGMLPWLAGILIILLGFGVLSWRPKKKTRKARLKQKIDLPSGKSKIVVEPGDRKKRRLVRSSRDKKIAGVCGGIADYFGIDPTLVRIAFVIGTIASGGPFFLAYLVLSFIMPKPESIPLEERITIIRDH